MRTFGVRPSGQTCGALITGIDLTEPLDDATTAALRQAWLTHQVIAFPDQQLTVEELKAVARAFGPHGEDPYIAPIDGHPHVVEVRREADEETSVFADAWHSDWSFLAIPPAGTMLYGVDIPPIGGDTLYANQYASYDALSDARKEQLAGLMGIHSARRGYAKDAVYGVKDVGRSMAIITSDAAMATQLHPLVRVHPETGRSALFCSLGYTIGIDGMDDDEAQVLLFELCHHCVEERFVYRHSWSTGMVTLWDNRCLLHSATGGYEGHRRLLQRITVAER